MRGAAGFMGSGPVSAGGIERRAAGMDSPTCLGLLIFALSTIFYDERLRSFSTPQLFTKLNEFARKVRSEAGMRELVAARWCSGR